MVHKIATAANNFVRKNPVKVGALVGASHGGLLGGLAGAGVVKAYQNRKKIKRVFKKLKNTIRRR
jgi:hypothetical protein